MTTLGDLLGPYVARVEEEMRRALPPLDARPSFFGQIYYHLGWANQAYEPEASSGGKRVRAAFCLMACEAVSGGPAAALPAAAAIEFLHEFSLIHDDIVDGDRTRRHRPALWTLVGQSQAINTGDGLFALAQQALLRSRARGVPAARVLDAQARFNETAVELCVGQHLDMSFEKREIVSPEEYLVMIQGKTAALLAFAGEAGAAMGGADEDSTGAFYQLGEALGLAFQMRDDLLGLWGDSRQTGKPVGADIRAKKKSLPVVYALSRPGSERLRALYATDPMDDSQVAEANQLIEATGARDFVTRLANEQAERAITLLEQIDVPAASLAPLRQLVNLLVHREH
jgi:geranylgeranyl diphosphate synthase, type I